MKNPFKRKKEKFPTASAPRSLDEINTEHYQLLAAAGKSQYLANVYSDEVKAFNERLRAVNREGQVRKELDKQNAEQAAKAQADAKPTQEATNEQV